MQGKPTLAQIDARIGELKADGERIARELATLEDTRRRAQALASAHERQRGHMARVLERMQRGEYVVIGVNPFWCRDGELLDRAWPDDMEAVLALQQAGAVASETRASA